MITLYEVKGSKLTTQEGDENFKFLSANTFNRVTKQEFSGHTHPFSGLTNIPNTLSGHNITDAYTKQEVLGLLSGYTGQTFTKIIPNSSFTVGTLLGFDGENYVKPIASNQFNAEVLGIVTKIISPSLAELTLYGLIDTTGWNLSANTAYFLSIYTQGAYSAVDPIELTGTTGMVRKLVFVTIESTQAFFYNEPGEIISSGGTGGIGLVYEPGPGISITGNTIQINLKDYTSEEYISLYSVNADDLNNQSGVWIGREGFSLTNASENATNYISTSSTGYSQGVYQYQAGGIYEDSIIRPKSEFGVTNPTGTTRLVLNEYDFVAERVSFDPENDRKFEGIKYNSEVDYQDNTLVTKGWVEQHFTGQTGSSGTIPRATTAEYLAITGTTYSGATKYVDLEFFAQNVGTNPNQFGSEFGLLHELERLYNNVEKGVYQLNSQQVTGSSATVNINVSEFGTGSTYEFRENADGDIGYGQSYYNYEKGYSFFVASSATTALTLNYTNLDKLGLYTMKEIYVFITKLSNSNLTVNIPAGHNTTSFTLTKPRYSNYCIRVTPTYANNYIPGTVVQTGSPTVKLNLELVGEVNVPSATVDDIANYESGLYPDAVAVADYVDLVVADLPFEIAPQLSFLYSTGSTAPTGSTQSTGDTYTLTTDNLANFSNANAVTNYFNEKAMSINQTVKVTNNFTIRIPTYLLVTKTTRFTLMVQKNTASDVNVGIMAQASPVITDPYQNYTGSVRCNQPLVLSGASGTWYSLEFYGTPNGQFGTPGNYNYNMLACRITTLAY